MFDALSPQRRRLVLGTAIGLLLLIMTLALISVIRLIAGTTNHVSQTDPGPVLLVPGYGGNLQPLEPLAEALRSSGRTAVIVDPLGDGTGDLRTHAEHLGEVADRVREDAGAVSVDVVGYSAGGVVARVWVRDGDGGDMARRVLTLGSPQHGTTRAALGAEFAGSCPVACQQLIPDSDLLRRLNAGDETPAGPLWATIRSTTDQVVTPSTPPPCPGRSISSSRTYVRARAWLTARFLQIPSCWQPSIRCWALEHPSRPTLSAADLQSSMSLVLKLAQAARVNTAK